MSFLRNLANYIPPPSFLTMPSVGVDVSDTSLKYVSFLPSLRSNRAKVLEQWGDLDIPSGVLEEGKVKDVKALARVFKEFKLTSGAEFIRLSLPEEEAYIFETKIKNNIPPKELRSILEFKLEENVPIPVREAVFDYELVPSSDTNMLHIVVAAYQREVVANYYEACLEAGLTPLSFEVEAQAMGRALVSEKTNEVVLLADFGKTRTGIGILLGGALLYTSTIDVGGARLSEMLRREFGKDLTEEDLNNFKNNFGLVRSLDDTRVYDSLLPTVSVIKDEIALRMQYWHQSNDNRPERRIKKVIICGGTANMRGLPEYLTEALNLPVLRGNVWENAFDVRLVVPPIDRRYSFGYTTAIGLALKNTI